ncbi:MAG: acyl-CoA dehydrogenase family protein [Archangium sp.]|nr:acyl-CoA dehydrogenase family protein [Archangium sp.]
MSNGFRGGEFLVRSVGTVMSPESFTSEQRALAMTAQRFAREEVLPHAARIEAKDFPFLRDLLRKAGEVGLLGVDIAETYGGLELDKTTSLLVASANSVLGSWSVTFGAQTSIGTMPIAYFGNDAQKAQWLPFLASGEKVSAYALTEPGSGSDALGARTRAVLDGDSWVLDGTKQFITNAAFADVFIVFAKVDGEKFSAFIVPRETPGLSIGAEEHKLGLRGSSTCQLLLEGARIPKGNLLGEVGKGAKIAFNILNIGRLKLGAAVIGGMKLGIENTLNYCNARKQFGKSLMEFGLTKEKFARMTMNTYVVESMAYRTSGYIDEAIAGGSAPLKAIEEFSIEASIMKVLGSEMSNQLIDDALQLHGGYGYVADYPLERGYRDVRINRIFEGTNEINRMLVTGMLLKRAFKGELSLFDERPLVSDVGTPADKLKQLALMCMKAAGEAFGMELEHHQVVLAYIADIVIDAYALDSVAARTAKHDAPWRAAAVELFTNVAHQRCLAAAQKVLCVALEGAELEQGLAKARALHVFKPHDAEVLNETIASAVEASRGYPTT